MISIIDPAAVDNVLRPTVYRATTSADCPAVETLAPLADDRAGLFGSSFPPADTRRPMPDGEATPTESDCER
jgi:hypothetical protein